MKSLIGENYQWKINSFAEINNHLWSKSPNIYPQTNSNLFAIIKKIRSKIKFIKMQKLCRYFSSIENFSLRIREIFLKPFVNSEKNLFIILFSSLLFSSLFFHSRYFTSRVFLHQCSSEFRNNQTAHWHDITGKNYTSAEFFGMHNRDTTPINDECHFIVCGIFYCNRYLQLF